MLQKRLQNAIIPILDIHNKVSVRLNNNVLKYYVLYEFQAEAWMDVIIKAIKEEEMRQQMSMDALRQQVVSLEQRRNRNNRNQQHRHQPS